MTIGDFISKLASKAGKANDPKLVELLSNSEFANTKMPEELANAIDQSLMTEEAAVANSRVRTLIRKETLDGMDSELETLINDLGLDEDSLKPLKEERNTFKRVPMLVKTIRELEAKKANATKGADKDEIAKQIAELNKQVIAAKEQGLKDLDAAKQSHTSEITGLMLKNILGTKQYTFPKETPADLQITLAHNVIQQAMVEKGVHVVNENGQLKLLKKEDGLPFHNAEHVALSVIDFADQTLAANGLLLINNQPDKGKPGAPELPGGGGGGAPIGTPDAIAEQIAKLQ